MMLLLLSARFAAIFAYGFSSSSTCAETEQVCWNNGMEFCEDLEIPCNPVECTGDEIKCQQPPNYDYQWGAYEWCQNPQWGECPLVCDTKVEQKCWQYNYDTWESHEFCHDKTVACPLECQADQLKCASPWNSGGGPPSDFCTSDEKCPLVCPSEEHVCYVYDDSWNLQEEYCQDRNVACPPHWCNEGDNVCTEPASKWMGAYQWCTSSSCPVICTEFEQSCYDADGQEYCHSNDETCPVTCKEGENKCSSPGDGHTAANEWCSYEACPVICGADEQTCYGTNNTESCLSTSEACPVICMEGEQLCTEPAMEGYPPYEWCSTSSCPVTCGSDQTMCWNDKEMKDECHEGNGCPVECAADQVKCGESTDYPWCNPKDMPCPVMCGETEHHCMDADGKEYCLDAATACPTVCSSNEVKCTSPCSGDGHMDETEWCEPADIGCPTVNQTNAATTAWATTAGSMDAQTTEAWATIASSGSMDPMTTEAWATIAASADPMTTEAWATIAASGSFDPMTTEAWATIAASGSSDPMTTEAWATMAASDSMDGMDPMTTEAWATIAASGSADPMTTEAWATIASSGSFDPMTTEAWATIAASGNMDPMTTEAWATMAAASGSMTTLPPSCPTDMHMCEGTCYSNVDPCPFTCPSDQTVCSTPGTNDTVATPFCHMGEHCPVNCGEFEHKCFEEISTVASGKEYCLPLESACPADCTASWYADYNMTKICTSPAYPEHNMPAYEWCSMEDMACPVYCDTDETMCHDHSTGTDSCFPKDTACPVTCYEGEHICESDATGTKWCSMDPCPVVCSLEEHVCKDEATGGDVCFPNSQSCPLVCGDDEQKCTSAASRWMAKNSWCQSTQWECPINCAHDEHSCWHADDSFCLKLEEACPLYKECTAEQNHCIMEGDTDKNMGAYQWCTNSDCPITCGEEERVCWSWDSATMTSSEFCYPYDTACPIECSADSHVCNSAGNSEWGPYNWCSTMPCPMACKKDHHLCESDDPTSEGFCLPNVEHCPKECGEGEHLCVSQGEGSWPSNAWCQSTDWSCPHSCKWDEVVCKDNDGTEYCQNIDTPCPEGRLRRRLREEINVDHEL